MSSELHVLVLPDRDTARDVARIVVERFLVDGEPRLVRDALAGEDDAEDAQWLLVVEGTRLDPRALDALAEEFDGWREEQ